MAAPGGAVRDLFHMGRVHYHLLHDGHAACAAEEVDLLFVFIHRLFLQLHHPLCLRRPARSDLLHAAKGHPRPGVYPGAYGRHHYL